MVQLQRVKQRSFNKLQSKEEFHFNMHSLIVHIVIKEGQEEAHLKNIHVRCLAEVKSKTSMTNKARHTHTHTLSTHDSLVHCDAVSP